MRNFLFQKLADIYPISLVHKSKVANFFWLLSFYLFKPSNVILKTSDYLLSVHPNNRQTLGRQILKKVSYEPAETKVFLEHIKPGMQIADVGANVGHFSLIGGKQVGGKGNVFAFEPFPIAYQELEENIKLNGLDNVQTFNLCLGDKKGDIEFYIDQKRGGHHSRGGENIRELGQTIKVQTLTLDAIDKEYNQSKGFDVIKSDTQGSEAFVLRGAKKIIKNHKPIILMEFWPEGLKRCDSDPWELLDWLQGFNYQFYIIQDDGQLALSSMRELKEYFEMNDPNSDLNLLLKTKD